MRLEEFERLVEDGYMQLPEWVQEKISNVAVLIEDEPSDEVRKAERLGPDETLLGYYQGIPLTARGEHYGVGATMPDTVILYRLPIEEVAEDNVLLQHSEKYGDRNSILSSEEYKEAVRKEVADTIWHEFAHHFGMDEHEVRSREEKREKPDLV